MLPAGRAKLDELAVKLLEWEARGDSRVVITGHTDRYGDDMYNMNLSMLRAQTVRQYLISKGIAARKLTATGASKHSHYLTSRATLTHQRQFRFSVCSLTAVLKWMLLFLQT